MGTQAGQLLVQQELHVVTPDHVGGLHEFDHRVVHGDEAHEVAEAQLAALETAAYGAALAAHDGE